MDFYLLALIVGGGLTLLSLLGGHDTDLSGAGEAGNFSADAHAEALDMTHADTPPHTETGDLASWFSMRAVVSFIAMFGLAGVLGRLLGLAGTGLLLTALVSGLLAGFITTYLFRLAREKGNLTFEAATLVGRVGTVIIPSAPNKLGRVLLEVGAQSEQFTARSEVALEAGQTVIVTSHEQGILEVQPWSEGHL